MIQRQSRERKGRDYRMHYKERVSLGKGSGERGVRGERGEREEESDRENDREGEC